jgi:hypothetical protein
MSFSLTRTAACGATRAGFPNTMPIRSFHSDNSNKVDQLAEQLEATAIHENTERKFKIWDLTLDPKKVQVASMYKKTFYLSKPYVVFIMYSLGGDDWMAWEVRFKTEKTALEELAKIQKACPDKVCDNDIAKIQKVFPERVSPPIVQNKQ